MVKKFFYNNKKFVVSSLVLGIILIGGCINYTTIQLPTNVKQTCIVSAVEFASWFISGAVTLNGAVKPANSVTFSNIPNCDFFKWSEQMFLWLTSPTPPSYGGGNGQIFNSPAFYTISPPDVNGDRTFLPNTVGNILNFNVRAAQVGKNKFPVMIEKVTGKLFEIVPPVISPNGKQLILNEKGDTVEVERAILGKDKKPTFFDKSNQPILGVKPILPKHLIEEVVVQKFIFDKIEILVGTSGNIIDSEQGQAGGGQVLMAINGSLVYFISFVNQVYTFFATGAKNNDPLITNPNFFPTTQAELNGIISYAAANGKTIIDPEALAIELKTSWVEASGLPNNGSDYITMTATIPTYNTTNPNQWIPIGQKTVKMAMTGMHVVGSTAGHSEMLWATFEHESNAPNVSYDYINSSNVTITEPQNTTTGDWLLCWNNPTGLLNDPHMELAGGNIQSIGTHTISQSNTLRKFPWGISPSSTSINTAIISLNNSVRGMLASGDIRTKYFHAGTGWTIGGASPNSGNQVGSNQVAGSTMETYQVGSNCFSCHGSNQVGVSHIYPELKPLF
ncbi:MAG: hypothetical protein WBB02_12705 [Saprospiraceae bacterium]